MFQVKRGARSIMLVDLRSWIKIDYERKKKLPAQKAGGRYKGNPYSGDMILSRACFDSN
jgi:hypothetical protein